MNGEEKVADDKTAANREQGIVSHVVKFGLNCPVYVTA